MFKPLILTHIPVIIECAVVYTVLYSTVNGIVESVLRLPLHALRGVGHPLAYLGSHPFGVLDCYLPRPEQFRHLTYVSDPKSFWSILHSKTLRLPHHIMSLSHLSAGSSPALMSPLDNAESAPRKSTSIQGKSLRTVSTDVSDENEGTFARAKLLNREGGDDADEGMDQRIKQTEVATMIGKKPQVDNVFRNQTGIKSMIVTQMALMTERIVPKEILTLEAGSLDNTLQ